LVFSSFVIDAPVGLLVLSLPCLTSVKIQQALPPRPCPQAGKSEPTQHDCGSEKRDGKTL
jgi:hypothetical protein